MFFDLMINVHRAPTKPAMFAIPTGNIVPNHTCIVSSWNAPYKLTKHCNMKKKSPITSNINIEIEIPVESFVFSNLTNCGNVYTAMQIAAIIPNTNDVIFHHVILSKNPVNTISYPIFPEI
jgi:hypothetical protein